MVFVGAQHAQMLFRGFDRDFGFVFRVDGDFVIFLRHGACFEQRLGALQLSARQHFVRDGLPVIGEGAGDIRALHLSRSWPLVTVSPSRAWISSTRPEAIEITGILRETSGVTVPVTFNSGAASYLPAVTTGYCSGWSTVTTLEFPAGTTCAGGGASSFGSTLGSALPSRSRPDPERQPHTERRHK